MPILSITGPRQSGKTTLAKSCFPDYDYVSLENPDTLAIAKFDPRSFLLNKKKGLIIDEVQQMPELFSYLQTISDASGKNGEFILTGSQNFLLSRQISQTLAGRVFISHLLPFTFSELNNTAYWERNSLKRILHGAYPRMLVNEIEPELFFPSYIQSYSERDVRQLLNISDLPTFQRFMRLLAGRTGQLINYNSIATELGVDMKTIKSWTNVLEASFLVFFLQPHHINYNKRIVKTPKLYFYDTGIACSLLGIHKEEDLETHWAKGALFENLIVSDIQKKILHNVIPARMYFWRDNTGNELDLLIEKNSTLIVGEIKSSETINPSFFKGLDFYEKISGQSKNQFLIYGGNEPQRRGQTRILPWGNASDLIGK